MTKIWYNLVYNTTQNNNNRTEVYPMQSRPQNNKKILYSVILQQYIEQFQKNRSISYEKQNTGRQKWYNLVYNTTQNNNIRTEVYPMKSRTQDDKNGTILFTTLLRIITLEQKYIL